MADVIRAPGVRERGVVRNRNLVFEVSSEGLGTFSISLMWLMWFTDLSQEMF